jgi:hypothetical protein
MSEHVDQGTTPRGHAAAPGRAEAAEAKKPFVPPRLAKAGRFTEVTTQFIGQFTA